jgi:hypothetical protein
LKAIEILIHTKAIEDGMTDLYDQRIDAMKARERAYSNVCMCGEAADKHTEGHAIVSMADRAGDRRDAAQDPRNTNRLAAYKRKRFAAPSWRHDAFESYGAAMREKGIV